MVDRVGYQMSRGDQNRRVCGQLQWPAHPELSARPYLADVAHAAVVDSAADIAMEANIVAAALWYQFKKSLARLCYSMEDGERRGRIKKGGIIGFGRLRHESVVVRYAGYYRFCSNGSW